MSRGLYAYSTTIRIATKGDTLTCVLSDQLNGIIREMENSGEVCPLTGS